MYFFYGHSNDSQRFFMSSSLNQFSKLKMLVFSFVSLVILNTLLDTTIMLHATPFSGVYLPDISDSLETYAGSWLVPLSRFMSAKSFILYSHNNTVQYVDRLEGGSFGMLFTGSHINIMTRDYFDLFVIHLSSTTNTLPGTDTPYKAIEKELLNRMKMTVKHLKNKAVSEVVPSHIYTTASQSNSNKSSTGFSLFGSTTTTGTKNNSNNTNSIYNKRWKDQTVALIIFSTQSASADSNTFNINIRKLYFKSTFYSLYKYYKYIVVTTNNNNDLLIIQNMKLPVWKLVNVMPADTIKSGSGQAVSMHV